MFGLLRGKGVFMRGDPDDYPNGFASWASTLDLSWVAVHGYVPHYREQALAARRLGLKVLLWAGPKWWSPTRWRTTADLLERRAIEVDAWGVIADPEDWANPRVDPSNRWGLAGLDEIGALGDRLALMRRRGLHVAVTSFPSWGIRGGRNVLATRSGAIGMPQVYSPEGAATLLARANLWRDFRSVVPVLAAWNGRGGGWTRTAAQATEYVKLFDGFGGIGFWTLGQRTTENEGFANVIRRAQSGGVFGIPKATALLVGAGIVAALVATGTLKMKR